MSKKAAKKLAAIKRRQNRAERRRIKSVATRYRLPGIKREKPQPGLDDWTEEEETAWVCQGVNHLASNYEEALWTPLFPELYEGRTYTAETIVKTIQTVYDDKLTGEGYSDGKAIIAWAIQDKATHYSFRAQCLVAAAKKYPDADAEELIQQPHQSAIWGVFDKLKTTLSKRLNGLTS